jgi:hypothetical protein
MLDNQTTTDIAMVGLNLHVEDAANAPISRPGSTTIHTTSGDDHHSQGFTDVFEYFGKPWTVILCTTTKKPGSIEYKVEISKVEVGLKQSSRNGQYHIYIRTIKNANSDPEEIYSNSINPHVGHLKRTGTSGKGLEFSTYKREGKVVAIRFASKQRREDFIEKFNYVKMHNQTHVYLHGDSGFA